MGRRDGLGTLREIGSQWRAPRREQAGKSPPKREAWTGQPAPIARSMGVIEIYRQLSKLRVEKRISDVQSSWGSVMKRIRILILILCACFVSVAWGQQAASTCHKLDTVPRGQHAALEPVRKSAQRQQCWEAQLKWGYATGGFVYSSPAVVNGVVYVGSTTTTCTR